MRNGLRTHNTIGALMLFILAYTEHSADDSNVGNRTTKNIDAVEVGDGGGE